jgi:hypothetical protein
MLKKIFFTALTLWLTIFFTYKNASLHELIKCIRKFERKCNSEFYKRYADHTKKVLEIIIKRKGEWSDTVKIMRM